MLKQIAIIMLLATVGVAQAQVAPDLAPVNCAWSQFSPAEQERLRNDFKVDSSGSYRVLTFRRRAQTIRARRHRHAI